MENEGCTSAEWLTELQAKSATELEELIAAAMASDDLKNNNAITSPGVSQEAHAHSRWVLPDAAKTQLKNAQQDAEEQAVQMWTPLTIDIDHVVRALLCVLRVAVCSTLPRESDLVRCTTTAGTRWWNHRKDSKGRHRSRQRSPVETRQAYSFPQGCGDAGGATRRC